MRYELADFLVPDNGLVSSSFLLNGLRLSNFAPWTQVEHWHQGLAMEFRFVLNANPSEILKQVGASSSSILKAGVTVYSPKTRLKFLAIEDMNDDGLGDVTLPIPPYSAGGDLRIQGFITIKHVNGVIQGDLVPPQDSIIWSTEVQCELEGDQGRAEIHPIDFASSPGLDRNSLWILDDAFPSSASEWMEAEVNNCISVRYNESRKDELHTPMGVQILKTDYVKAILEAAVNTEGVLENLLLSHVNQDSWGSLMKTAFDIVSALMPEATAPEVVARWTHNQKLIESTIQGLAAR